MAKSRRNRSGGSRRADPMGEYARPVKAPADPQLAALRTSRILPIVQELRNADPKKRTAAASAIANIVEDARCRKLLLREQIVHVVLTETLADTGIESRAAGWEILNVLAQFEEADFCVHLFRCDVLTPAAHALTQVVKTLQPAADFTKRPKAQQEFVWRLTLSLVELVGQLAEAREEIQEAIASGHAAIAQALFALAALPPTLPPAEIHWAVVGCVARLCDGQRVLSQALVDDHATSCYRALQGLVEAGGPMAVAACAALHSVFAALEWFDHSPGRDGALDAALVPALTKALEEPQQTPQVLSQALQVLAMMGTTMGTALEKGNRDVAALRKSGQAAAETKDLGSDDEMVDGDAEGKEEEEREDKEDDDEDDTADDDMADLENVTGADDETAALGDLPTLRALIHTAVPAVIQVVRTRSKDADEAALAIELDALSALNNIAWTVSCLDLSDVGNAGIQHAWMRAARQIWLDVVRPLVAGEAGSTVDLQLVARTTGLAWALARALGGETPSDVDEPSRFMGLREVLGAVRQTDTDSDQSSAVLCMGVLGQMARDPAPTTRNAAIGEYLVAAVEALPTTPAAEAVEALNQLFDIYGDENVACDRDVFWPGRFLERLETAVPKAKAMAKTIDKRTQGELRTRADEAVLNLGRFVQYKKKHRPQEFGREK